MVVSVGVGVIVGVEVGLRVLVGVAVEVGVLVGLGVDVWVGVGVAVGVPVMVGVSVGRIRPSSPVDSSSVWWGEERAARPTAPPRATIRSTSPTKKSIRINRCRFSVSIGEG